MAHKKGQGSVKNGRESHSKRLGGKFTIQSVDAATSRIPPEARRVLD